MEEAQFEKGFSQRFSTATELLGGIEARQVALDNPSALFRVQRLPSCGNSWRRHREHRDPEDVHGAQLDIAHRHLGIGCLGYR
jgi:hypothetical protein